VRRFLRAVARFLRSTPLDPTVIRLRTMAPTVTRAETRKLGPRWILDDDVPRQPPSIPDDLPIG